MLQRNFAYARYRHFGLPMTMTFHLIYSELFYSAMRMTSSPAVH